MESNSILEQGRRIKISFSIPSCNFLIFVMNFCLSNFVASEVESGVFQLSNEANIVNCTFMRNSAVEYGAALCLAAPILLLRDSSSVQPMTIANW